MDIDLRVFVKSSQVILEILLMLCGWFDEILYLILILWDLHRWLALLLALLSIVVSNILYSTS